MGEHSVSTVGDVGSTSSTTKEVQERETEAEGKMGAVSKSRPGGRYSRQVI